MTTVTDDGAVINVVAGTCAACSVCALVVRHGGAG